MASRSEGENEKERARNRQRARGPFAQGSPAWPLTHARRALWEDCAAHRLLSQGRAPSSRGEYPPARREVRWVSEVLARTGEREKEKRERRLLLAPSSVRGSP